MADSRDALLGPRLAAALASCHDCRTEANCTEVCPKGISPTRAIKYIQRLALTHKIDKPEEAIEPEKAAELATPRPGIDRVSSAWLIRRFIDKDAEFIYVAPDQGQRHICQALSPSATEKNTIWARPIRFSSGT